MQYLLYMSNISKGSKIQPFAGGEIVENGKKIYI